MILGAFGHFDPDQLLDGQDIGDVVGKRRKIIEPVRVRNELVIAAVLGDLLVTTVQIPELGHHRRHRFAVQPDEKPQDAVRRRMLRSHVEDHLILQRVVHRDGRVLVFQRGQDLALLRLFRSSCRHAAQLSSSAIIVWATAGNQECPVSGKSLRNG